MNIDKLRQEVLEANLELPKRHLVISTWGNVSGYDPEENLMVIKASGVPYEQLKLEHMVAVDMDGNVLDSKYRPSTDTMTHIVLYKFFKERGADLRGIVHTHSPEATAWAQLGRDIPCFGTTHCDYFYGNIPCTRYMTTEEIQSGYELNTGRVIVERFQNLNPVEMQAVLVRKHAPFVWGKTPLEAVLHSQILEYVAKMATYDELLSKGTCENVPQDIANKHYNRKFGPNAYYGQEA